METEFERGYKMGKEKAEATNCTSSQGERTRLARPSYPSDYQAGFVAGWNDVYSGKLI